MKSKDVKKIILLRDNKSGIQTKSKTLIKTEFKKFKVAAGITFIRV